MQHGYANKKNKNKKNKNKNKKQQAENAGAPTNDVDMQEAKSEDMDEIDYTVPKDQPQKLTGKAGHLHKVQLKKSLKVKVTQLRQQRTKLTKLPGNKPMRKELSGKLKELVQEQAMLTTKSGKKKQAGAAADETA